MDQANDMAEAANRFTTHWLYISQLVLTSKVS